MHPEYQINNNNVGRKILANEKICNKVVEEQHGYRKHHQARLLLLNKVLVGDLFRLTRYSGCYGMNNAKGCYNRIDHIFAILVLMFLVYLGLLLQTCYEFSKKHVIVLGGYGVSEPVYGNKDEDKPITGINQSNRLGLSFWCLISTIIIKTCKQKGLGTTITILISKKEISLLGFAFVDGFNLVTAVNNVYTFGVEIIQKMQALMIDWCVCI